MRLGRLLAVVVVFALIVAGVTWWVSRQVPGLIPFTERCVVQIDDREVSLDLEQAEHAALMAAIADRRGLPARAVTIAIATSIQESKLRNIDYGDRDSLGLFQQRPSQGWGTPQQVQNPTYAINKFYDHLVKVPNYRTLPITEAAQAVQRSGYPAAYAQHEDNARALASALTGNSRQAFWCEVGEPEVAENTELNGAGLTQRAAKVRRALGRSFGDLPLGGFQPGGVTTGHMPGSAHYEGRAIDVFVRPISVTNKTRGWAIASYLVANAKRLKVKTVIFDDRIWHAGSRSTDGWSDYSVPSGVSGDRKILEHRDHVHVDVQGS